MNTRSILNVALVVLLLSAVSMSVAEEGTWTRKADMPTARLSLSTSVVNGKIYAIGGSRSLYLRALAAVEEYDPATDTWNRKADMPSVSYMHAAAVVNGKIYIIGGGTAPKVTVSTMLEYDPARDTWTNKADMPSARAFLSACVVNGKIYAIGGASTFSTALRTVEEYDPATDTWIRKANMPTARACLSTSVVNGKIYAIGGGWHNALSALEEYDPVTDTWARKVNMPIAGKLASTSAVNGRVYAIGGATGGFGPVSSAVHEYDPATDTWTKKADMLTARWFLSTCVVDGKIYAIGGERGYDQGAIATVEAYDTGLTASQPDFNGDGLVNIKDLHRLIESWEQDDPFVDIAPPPFGDGIVDALDLELLMSYWEQPFDDPTLIAHWALDETEGTVAYDGAGMNDAFVMGGAAWQSSGGQVDGALHLDGIDGCAVAGPVLNPADGPFSALAWIQGGEPGQVVISQLNGFDWLGIDLSSGGLMTELCFLGRGGGPLQSETVVTDGMWHRVGLVWDGASRILYVDDIQVAEDIQDGLESSTGGLYLGTGKLMAPGTYFSGLIDDIRIYNRAISP